jgi:addiction module RelE/StbE family toxin
MRIQWHKNFVKHYKKRVFPYSNIKSKFDERIRLFAKDPQNPILKDHQLTQKWKNYRAFWIAGDLRVTYQIKGDAIWFYDVGSHNQVY